MRMNNKGTADSEGMERGSGMEASIWGMSRGWMRGDYTRKSEHVGKP